LRLCSDDDSNVAGDGRGSGDGAMWGMAVSEVSFQLCQLGEVQDGAESTSTNFLSHWFALFEFVHGSLSRRSYSCIDCASFHFPPST
jgi:hypothetical protein